MAKKLVIDIAAQPDALNWLKDYKKPRTEAQKQKDAARWKRQDAMKAKGGR